MNMFIHELKAYRKSTIIWTISLISIAIIFLAMFPAIAREADEFNKMMEGYPNSIKKALGFTVESITSIMGYYSYVVIYNTLWCNSIYEYRYINSVKRIKGKDSRLSTKQASKSQNYCDIKVTCSINTTYNHQCIVYNLNIYNDIICSNR